MPNEDDLVEATLPSDADLFAAANADVPAETPDTEAGARDEQPEVEASGQPRDESGRFASKAGDPPAEVVTPAGTQPSDAEGGQIPAWRLREEADNRRRVETELADTRRQIEELRRNPPKPAEQPKPESKPDPLLDPDGFEAYLERKVEARFEAAEQARVAERGERSFQAARGTSTEDQQFFDKAYAEARGDATAAARILKARDPGKELLTWYRERETVREVGGDPAAYKQRLLDEALKDPAFLAKAVAAARTPATPSNVASLRQPSPVRLPPSLSSVAPTGSARGAEDDDVSDQGIWNYANAGTG